MSGLGECIWRGIYAGAVGFGAVIGFGALALIAVSIGAMIGGICTAIERWGKRD